MLYLDMSIYQKKKTIFKSKTGNTWTFYGLKEIECPRCLKKFLPTHPRTVYCKSEECLKLLWSKQYRNNRKGLLNQLSEQNCKVCNKKYRARALNNKGICGNFNCRYIHKLEKNKIWKQERPRDRNRLKHHLKPLNLTVEEYEAMEEYQDHSCKICGIHKSLNAKDKNGASKRLSIDHDHETMQIRGLLCHLCNLALGAFRDSIQNLENAVKYLIGSKSSKKYISEKKIHEKNFIKKVK